MVHLNVLPENASNPAKRSSDDQRENREERAQIREREGRSRLAAPTSGAIVAQRHERRDRLSSGAIDERARSTIASLVDRRARSSDAHRSSIDERRDRLTRDERARRSRSSIERRDQRSMIAIDERARLLSDDRAAHRSTSGARPTSGIAPLDRRLRRSSTRRGAIIPLSL